MCIEIRRISVFKHEKYTDDNPLSEAISSRQSNYLVSTFVGREERSKLDFHMFFGLSVHVFKLENVVGDL